VTRHGISLDHLESDTPGPIRCLCTWSEMEPTQGAFHASALRPTATANDRVVGLLIDAIIHLDAQLPPSARRPDACCDSHNEIECCDPNDCGPCCETCPTCPSLRKDWLEQLTVAERSPLAYSAYVRAANEDDPRYWSSPDPAQRARVKRRWALIAHALDPDYPLPKQETT